MSGGPLIIPEPVDLPVPPPTARELSPGGVELWQASLEGAADEVSLSEEERARADRAASAAARARFVRGRFLLRHILAGYVGVPASELRFGEEREGKPFLRKPFGGPSFNLSHAGSYWALAVCAERSVGVDIERFDRQVDVDGIARRIFAESERRTIAALAHDAKAPAFFRCWAAREAVVKGLGTRLLLPGVAFEVDAGPDRPLRARAVGGGEFAWWLAEFPVPPPWIGVLAVDGPPASVRSFRIRG